MTGAYGEPTAEAVAYLQENLIAPAQKVLNQNDVVTEVTYKTYVSVYNQFLAMPRTSILDGISEEYYYRIENGYFTNYYAYAGTVNVEPRTLEADADGFLWYFVKQEDGTLKIYSKVTNNPAYISSSAEGQTIKVNSMRRALRTGNWRKSAPTSRIAALPLWTRRESTAGIPIPVLSAPS